MSAKNAGLIFTPGSENWWDSERISNPIVMHCGDRNWKMWYYGRDPNFDRAINLPTGRCGLAISEDGIHWERVRGNLTMGAVLEPSSDENRFDSGHIGVNDVQFHNDLYWMWYFGGDRTITKMGNIEAKGINMLPGCAVSRDGINWIKLEGPYKGAILDRGKPDEFDALFCGWPKILKDRENWKMYYHTLNPQTRKFIVGLALSEDGLHWQKFGQVLGAGEPGSFDEGGIGTRHIITTGDRYLMFYEGVDSQGNHSIGVAVSTDGIKWEKQAGSQDNGSIFQQSPKGQDIWDAGPIGTPYIVPMSDGSYRMYYVGTNEGGYDELSSLHQIGLAVSDGSNYLKWQRWE